MRLREAKKLASRGRVLEAAKALFEEAGFQATTVRMIAERAGLSPGGVFTTFDDKVAILCQIMSEQREQLFQNIEETAPKLTGTVRERLRAILNMAHADEYPRLKMVTAYIGASYNWSRKLEEDHRQLHRRLSKVIGDLLRDGAARGELRDDIDLDLLIEVISSVYLRNYRTAYYAGLDCAALDARMERQLDLIFDGAAAR